MSPTGIRPTGLKFTPRSRPTGFTLIELMIVVSLVAIILTISVTSYRTYMLRANRTDAGAYLMRLAAAQEKFYLDNNRYTNDPVDGLRIGAFSERGFYEVQINLDPNPATGYTAIVSPVAGQRQASDNDCQEFRIDESGRRSTAPKGLDTCWR